MQSPERWRHQTAFNVSQARRLQDLAGRRAELSQRAREDTATHHLTMTSELGACLAQKVSDTNSLIETLERRAESMESSVHRASQSLAQLERTRSTQDITNVVKIAFRIAEMEALIQTCAARMEQRKGRPKREQVRDAVEIALEEEMSVLLGVQRKLEDGGKKTRSMIAELNGKLEEVRRNIDEKKQALGVDQMCLKTTDSSFHSTMDRTMRSTAPANVGVLSPGSKRFNTHDPLALHEGVRNELIRQRRVAYMDQVASSREEAAEALVAENAALAARCERAAEEAAAATASALRGRVEDGQQARARLESEVQETHARIEQVMGAMAETKVHMKALHQPLELNSTCSTLRRQRGRREDITDPVSAILKDHQEAVQHAQQELSGQQHQEQATLGSLQERRQRLLDDLRDKTAAVHIDRGCMAGGPAPRRPGSGGSGAEPGREAPGPGAAEPAQRVLGSGASPNLRSMRPAQQAGGEAACSPRRMGGPLQLTARHLTAR